MESLIGNIWQVGNGDSTVSVRYEVYHMGLSFFYWSMFVKRIKGVTAGLKRQNAESVGVI